jgi:hypothetical protein
MQAPRRMLARLLQAATSNNVAELERLRQLDMAIRSEYCEAFHYALEHECIAAAIHLWFSAKHVPSGSNERDVDEIMNSCTSRLLMMVLESADSQWALQLAQHQSLEYLLTTLDSISNSPRTIRYNQQSQGVVSSPAYNMSTHHCVDVNLLELVRYYRMRQEDGTSDKCLSRLAKYALLAALTFSIHPWQGTYVRVQELLSDTELGMHEVIESCIAIDRYPGHEETTVLQMLLSQLEGDATIDDIFRACCEFTKIGLPTQMLLDRYGIYHANLASAWAEIASECGSCVVLESCLDRVGVIDSITSGRLLCKMFDNYRMTYTSRALAHVLDRLLLYANLDDIQWLVDTKKHPRRIHIFLLEHLSLRKGWRITDLQCLPMEIFLWLCQRNPAAFNTLSPHMNGIQVACMQNFFAQQVPVRDALLACTPLANVLMELVLQYA